VYKYVLVHVVWNAVPVGAASVIDEDDAFVPRDDESAATIRDGQSR
jgi:hypothetical protein